MSLRSLLSRFDYFSGTRWPVLAVGWQLIAFGRLRLCPARPTICRLTRSARSIASSRIALLKRFCLECHSTADQEGELDLERFATLADVRRSPPGWQKVAEMLDNGEMPPQDAMQPTADERRQLREWVAPLSGCRSPRVGRRSRAGSFCGD